MSETAIVRSCEEVGNTVWDDQGNKVWDDKGNTVWDDQGRQHRLG